LTEVSESLVPLLPSLDDQCSEIVLKAAQLHPSRWRAELRACLDDPRRASPEAAAILEEIGERSDVVRLRKFAKAHRRNRRTSNYGRGLARRLADRVFVEDQGRVVIRVGPREVPGSTIRRKVLGLLCFLLARSESAATRDQVLDAMWPDLDPVVATNSLNQTLYFLRRVFEEDYAEDLSPGYVHHESDVIWLDPDLVSSRTNECRRLIRAMPVQPSPDDVAHLASTYLGRFALDFEYEEWAASFREMVHAAYLEVIERSLLDDMTTGHHERAIAIARRALEVDPGSDQIEVSLLRLYKSIGAHSAAAEQYAHYSSVMRDDLGIEPPPLESL
jgi:DNA-binding SARP family transcriptional activator